MHSFRENALLVQERKVVQGMVDDKHPFAYPTGKQRIVQRHAVKQNNLVVPVELYDMQVIRQEQTPVALAVEAYGIRRGGKQFFRLAEIHVPVNDGDCREPFPVSGYYGDLHPIYLSHPSFA